MSYWLECLTSTAIPPTFVSDVVGQQNEIAGITFEVIFSRENAKPMEVASYTKK